MVPKKQGSTKQIKNDAFLEILRDLGSKTAASSAKDLLGGIPDDVLNQTGLRKSPQENTLYGDKNQEALLLENESLQRRLFRQETVRQEEKVVFSASQQETKAKIKTLQEEAKKLAQTVQTLDKEVERVVKEEVVNPGLYHESFFEKILSFIKSLTKKVTSATTWLSLVVARGKKRSHYWAQVNRSGSKYLLSQERYMSTQAG